MYTKKKKIGMHIYQTHKTVQETMNNMKEDEGDYNLLKMKD